MSKINGKIKALKTNGARRSTALDVSRLAGVARSTVSRAITSPESVKDETLQKINEAMATLKYRPSAFGRGLVSGKQGVIGVVTDTQIYNHRRDDLVDGINVQIGSEYWIGSSAVKRNVSEEDLEHLPLISQHTCDGFIFNIESSGLDLDAFAKRHYLPSIVVNPTNYLPCNSIILDDQSTAEDAVKYLVSKGHKRIAYLTGVGHSHDLSLGKRENGYEIAMLRAGLRPMDKFKDRLAWDPGQTRFDAIQERVKGWLQQDDPPTVILSYDYSIAMELMRVAYSNSWAIPEKFSIMACDDAPFLNEVVIPITAMSSDWNKIGNLATEMLLQKINDPDKEIPNAIIKSKVIERKSVVSL